MTRGRCEDPYCCPWCCAQSPTEDCRDQFLLRARTAMQLCNRDGFAPAVSPNVTSPICYLTQEVPAATPAGPQTRTVAPNDPARAVTLLQVPSPLRNEDVSAPPQGPLRRGAWQPQNATPSPYAWKHVLASASLKVPPPAATQAGWCHRHGPQQPARDTRQPPPGVGHSLIYGHVPAAVQHCWNPLAPWTHCSPRYPGQMPVHVPWKSAHGCCCGTILLLSTGGFQAPAAPCPE